MTDPADALADAVWEWQAASDRHPNAYESWNEWAQIVKAKAEALKAALVVFSATRELRAAEREILDFTITGISKGEASLVKAIALVTAARKKAEAQK